MRKNIFCFHFPKTIFNFLKNCRTHFPKFFGKFFKTVENGLAENLKARVDFSLPIYFGLLWAQLLDKKCKFTDIFSPKTGLFGHLYSTNFRPFKIGKSWIASGVRPRNDIKPFRPNVLLKGTGRCIYLYKILFATSFGISINSTPALLPSISTTFAFTVISTSSNS